jgi:hypothetical protein
MSTPSAPIISYAPRSSDQRLEYQWSAPIDEGSSAITGYRLTLDDGTTPIVNTYGAGARYASVTGLTNGTLYTATIEATNDGSSYGPVASFRSFEPGSAAPGEPASVSAVAGPDYTTAIVSWTAPSSLPDSTIFWYVIISQSSNPADPVIKRTANGLTQTSLYITGLNSASTYTFSVQAVNCPGYSPAVITNSVGPVVATNGSVSFTTNDYFSMSPGIIVGTNDYTFEFWFKLPTIDPNFGFNTTPIFGPQGSDALGVETVYNAAINLYQFNVKGIGTSNISFSSPISPWVADTWYYVAFARSGTSVTMWMGTTPGGSAPRYGGGIQTDSSDLTGTTNYIGRINGYGGSSTVTNLRIINGSAYYNPSSTSITIPSTSLTSVTDTELLLLANTSGTLDVDTSGTQTLTAVGTPAWSSSTPYP